MEQPDLIHDQDCTMHELNRVSQVNKKSAPGSDGVHRNMLHHTGPGARQILLAFINKLYKDRRLPNIWKQAQQVPIRYLISVMHLDPFHYLVAFLKPWKALTTARPQFSDLLYVFLPHKGTTDGLDTLASAITEKMGTGKKARNV